MRFTNKRFDKCCATSMQTPKNAKNRAMNTCFFGYKVVENETLDIEGVFIKTNQN